jgi:hypothetical protein
MCAWIGKQGRFLDRDLLGFNNLGSYPLPSTPHSFGQQLSKQRATANNYFHPSTTKEEEPVTTPEVNQGRKRKNAGPRSEIQCNNHTKVEPPRTGLFEPDALFVANIGIGGLTKGIATLIYMVCSPHKVPQGTDSPKMAENPKVHFLSPKALEPLTYNKR